MAALDGDLARRTLSHLDAPSVDACRATSRALRALASEEALWRTLAARAFWPPGDASGLPALGEPLAPELAAPDPSDRDGDGPAPTSGVSAAPSWRLAYIRWAAAARHVGEESFSGPVWLTIARAWRDVEAALAVHAPDILSTLQPPAPRAWLGTLASAHLRALYAMHNGQALALDDAFLDRDRAAARAHQADVTRGMFGGYSAYDALVCTRLQPVARAERIMHTLGPAAFPDGTPARVFGSTWELRRVTCVGSDDRVRVGDFQGPRSGAFLPGPAPLLADWFAAFARRLRAGTYGPGRLVPEHPASQGILLFPQVPDGRGCCAAATSGVEVAISAVHAPEAPAKGFVYSVRIRGGVGALPGGAPTAQLESRRWVIHDGTGAPPREVVGPGVIGHFPIVAADGRWRLGPGPGAREEARLGWEHGWFVYQSVTGPLAGALDHPGWDWDEERAGEDTGMAWEGRPRPGAAPASFEGALSFVPGTLAQPLGPPFKVAVPRIRFGRQRYTF